MNLLARCAVPVVSIIISLAAIFWHWYWVLVLSVPLALLGIYDWTQTQWTITRNYPVLARIRWTFLKLRPFLRAYIVEDDINGTPYSYEARSLIRSRSRGETDTHPFGTQYDTSAEEYHWLNHSIAAEANPDKSPRITVGHEQTSKPYNASVFNISAMSFGALSARAIEALNIGAKLGGFYHDTGEGGVSTYHTKHGGDLVWELGSGYFGARDKNGNFDPEKFCDAASQESIKMTEIKLSQGAKPGHGGLLPAKKVTEEIARVRQVEAHKDCLSPRAHSAFHTPIEMLEFAAKMRDLSGGKPVGIKLCIGQPHEIFAIVKAILETEIYPEFIVIDGGEGGTGAAPLELSNWVGMPLIDGLILARNALVGTGLRAKIRLVASGKVYSGMGLARNMALGADWCNAARAFMMSVGCIQAQRCNLGTCPTGVTTQDAWRQRGLVPQVQGERAARFHSKTLESLSELVAAAGFAHPQDLQPHHLMQRVGTNNAMTVDRVHTFLPEGILLEEPEGTIYRHWWEAAAADSFHPNINLLENRAKGKAKDLDKYLL
jgi:glutamate synthase domain-containing protein 2